MALSAGQKQDIRESMLGQLSAYGNAYYGSLGAEAKTYLGNLFKLGDVSFSGFTLQKNGWIKRGSTPKVKTATTKKVSKNSTQLVVNKTEKGLNVPKALLRSLNIVGHNYRPVYLRPISNKSFLIMNKPGTNPGTISLYPQFSGKVVITNYLLSRLGINKYFSVATMSPNGTTGDTFIVSFH